MKKLTLLMVALLLLISTIPVAHAYEMNDNLKEVFFVLKDYGFSDVAAAAVVGNIYQESRGIPSAVEGGPKGVGIGIFQLGNNGNRQALEDYCAGPAHANHPKVTLSPAVAPKSYTICNRVQCQIDFSIGDIANRFGWAKWSKNYNKQVERLSVLASGVSAGSIPASINVVNSWEGFKAQDDLATAVIQFMCDYETPGATSCFWVGISSLNESNSIQYSFIDSFSERYGVALEIYNLYGIPEIAEMVVDGGVEVDEIVLDAESEIVESLEDVKETPVWVYNSKFPSNAVHALSLTSLTEKVKEWHLLRPAPVAYTIIEPENKVVSYLKVASRITLFVALISYAVVALIHFKKGVSSGLIVKISAVNRRALVCIAVIWSILLTR